MEFTVAGWFVGPIITKLINICYEYQLEDQPRWQTGVKKKLERLQANQDKIEAVVSAAIQAQKIDQNTKINNWIWRLRDAFDEADDVIDDFEYMKHKEQLARNKVHSTMSSLKKSGKRAFKIDPNLKRLQKIVQKLDKISAEVSTFSHLLENTMQEQQAQQDELQRIRETGSLPTNDLFILDKEKKLVIKWLKKPQNDEHQNHVTKAMYNNISLLSIIGHGGMGKTTLLQHVYNDEVTEDFDLKMWIFVSNNFDVKEVTKSMLESLTKTRPSEESLATLQNNLQSKVTSKKFLLVLDDIWEEDEVQDKIKWENFFPPLDFGGLGSKILITTRMNSAALMIAKVINKKNEQLILDNMNNLELLKILNARAFAGVENPDDLKKLRSITKELVEKLFGSPMAAKFIGIVLNSSMDETHWRNVFNKVMGYSGILPILKLSYIFLPKYLQNCFAFCSIFAQGHVFDKDYLVRMWIAVGFIQPSNIQEEDVEDIGRRYFDILVKKSFFEKDERGYKMHDLLHELAQSVSAQECFRIVGDEDSVSHIPKTIRHLFVKTINLELLKKLGKFKNLRTLFIRYAGRNQHFVDVLPKIFKETRGIRLLSIYAPGREMKPKAISCLKHLRYLNIYRPNFRLPRSVSDLFHLQFLICDYEDDIPRDQNDIYNSNYSHLPLFKCPGIGKLIFLHELNGFVVSKESGYSIGELKHMNDLRILTIKCLENVRDVEEASKAKLCDKKKLTDLSLKWEAPSQNIADVDRYARVLDNLQPHNNLKELTMKNYMGVRSAIWMNNANFINNLKNLEQIYLKSCLKWQNLPPFGQLPFLKYLCLRNMPEARFDCRYHGNDIQCLFPSLEKLFIENLEALKDWFDAGVDCLFPCLTELSLYNCPNMQELPYLPPKLKELTISKIGWKTLNFCSSISKSILLEKLEVRYCPNITIIPLPSEIIARPATIEIVACPNLLSLGGHQEVETTENGPNLTLDQLTISDPSLLQLEPLRSAFIKKLFIRQL